MEEKIIIGAIGAEEADGLMLEFHGCLAGQYLDGTAIPLSAFSLVVFERDYSKACPSTPR
jgi:hypothetical protein